MEKWQTYLNPELLTRYALEYGQAILFALVIFVVGKWLAKLFSRITRKALRRARVDETLVKFLGNILYSVLFAFVVIAALSKLGVETTSLAAIFAAAGLAIGLSLQGSLSNLASGVLIIMFRPFKAGDYIEAANVAGTVEEVGIFSSTLKTPDNKAIIVPNNSITSNIITNYSARANRRLDLVFSISYKDDIKRAKAVLQEVLDAEPRVLKDPASVIGVLALAESSVNLACRPWVKTDDYWDVHFALLEAVKERFDAEGVSIPFPQQEVTMYHVNAENQPFKQLLK